MGGVEQLVEASGKDQIFREDHTSKRSLSETTKLVAVPTKSVGSGDRIRHHSHVWAVDVVVCK